MSNDSDILELVKKARLGDSDGMSALTELAEPRVRAFVCRLTLDYDLAQDLTQETILELIKHIKNLNFDHANKFWSWLFKTASSKIGIHLRGFNNKRFNSNKVG